MAAISQGPGDEAVSLVTLSRQMLVALSAPAAPRVLSKIGLGQAVYALQTAIENFEIDPQGLYEEGINICMMFPPISSRYRETFEHLVDIDKAARATAPAP
jgi:hypothetical protein